VKLSRLFRTVRRRVGAEDGIALVVALSTTVVLGIAGTSMFVYTTSNNQATRLTAAETSAHAVAEAGIQAEIAILNDRDNNALDWRLINCTGASSNCTTTLNEGYARWSGVLCDGRSSEDVSCDRTWTGAPYWLLTSTGFVRNPDASTPATQTARARVTVIPTLSAKPNNPVWNFIYTMHPPTPGVCDETIQQQGALTSPLYVNGNLCLQNGATIMGGPVDVQGSVTMFQKANTIGTASQPVTDAHIGGGCQAKSKPYYNPCVNGSDDNVFAQTFSPTFAPIPPPEVFWDDWYVNASPGPYFPCNAPSGPVPVFDNDQGVTPDPVHRNDSVMTPFDLTPSVSYTCKTASGELSWDAVKHHLTVNGAIFIDGSAYIQDGVMNTYSGEAALYLSGTFLEKNSQLCAKVDPTTNTCDTKNWDPNAALLGIIANGQGGIVNTNDSEQFVSSTFQGAVYATHDIDTDTFSAVLGPMLANAVNLGQTVSTAFPQVKLVPASFPGNYAVYAKPQPAVYLTG
jgi:hypothetical protein